MSSSLSRRTVLVTGPIGRTAEYADAVRAAEYEPLVRELLEIRAVRVEPTVLPERTDWVCVTSKHALSALAPLARSLAGASAAVVGGETEARVRALGFDVALSARSASELASRLIARAPGASVFWPRGSLSDELARELRAGGLACSDPIAYETRERDEREPLPSAGAVFLASPSAVPVFLRRSTADDAVGIAIGPTTAVALEAARERFAELLVLARPEPRALTETLRALAARSDS